MDYQKFSDIINKTVFSDSKAKLLKSIAQQPENFIGLYRPTKPRVKIAQNLSQSHEIKFGYAFEQLIHLYLQENGCEMFPTSITINGKLKQMDIYFRKENQTFFVEQKIRDNHDSTKKQGQISDFEEKLAAVSNQDKKQVHGILFFVDPGMSKNKCFYLESLAEISTQYELETSVLYGGQFFDMLSLCHVWSEIEEYLVKWREQLPSFPEFNYDKDPKESFNEIKDMGRANFEKIFTHEEIGKYILPILFPTCQTLELLADYWSIHKKGGLAIAQLIKKRIAEINHHDQ